MTTAAYAKIPNWKISGEWFDVCNCNIPCPCEFAQAPTYGNCVGVLVWHVQKGLSGGETILDGLNVSGLSSFTGNIWTGQAKNTTIGFFIDEKSQRQALQMIFNGKAGGFLADFASLQIGEIRGLEFAPIKFEVADDFRECRSARKGSC